MNEGFGAGVSDGGLKKQYEVKVLVCFLLDSATAGLTQEEISKICTEEEFANYFEVTSALADLIQNEQVSETKGIYHLTETGLVRLELLLRELPLSIREKAVRSVAVMFQKKKRLIENAVTILPKEDGFELRMRILDVGTDLLELSLFAPNKETAKWMETNFLNAPARLYRGVLALLTEDDETLLEIAGETPEKLFEPDGM